MDQERDILWIGSSFDDLLAFPLDARRQAGFQLGKVQNGLRPDDWKPFDVVGPGTIEIRIGSQNGNYRVLYIAKFDDAVYVLHCFQKKSQTTSKADKALAASRYRAILNLRQFK